MIITLTGYSGFLGQNIVLQLNEKYRFNLLGRSSSSEVERQFNLNSENDISRAFENSDVVIHCAARAHVLNDLSTDPWGDYYQSNVALTVKLAERAIQSKIKRFIFMSSLKVNGEFTNGLSFSAFDNHNPSDFYAKTKSIAEVELKKIFKNSDVELVIIRPPLVYGSGVKANFAALFSLVAKGVPLPFGAINNRRSLVSVYNLVDLIDKCIYHPRAANQTFLVSDDHDLSTAEMVKLMAKVQGVKPWLLPVPLWFLRLIGKLTGKSDMISRLTDSLQVDITHTKETLDWTPPFSVEEGFSKCLEKKNV